ncbi:MAG: 3-dehydro-L-gulonate 2-dehydrogenase [Cyclobacteriaceae bacterium]
MKITFEELESTLLQVFTQLGFTNEKADLLAKVHAESTLDGVRSHGIGRVVRFYNEVKKGFVKTESQAHKIAEFGSLERWNGNQGSGVINATICTDRAVELAQHHGIGCVALRNTNHWMRGGTYGWQAANAGCIAIGFTNTKPNMPPWGGKESRIGNNPFVVAIPRKAGHVVLDMALSQYSFGKIDEYAKRGEHLPFPGGWDRNDQLTADPSQIGKGEMGLPIGYWKGSALSMILDMLVTILSAGDSTYRVSQKESEYGISQLFICIDPNKFGDGELKEKLLQEIIDYAHNVAPMDPDGKTYYPGERTLEARQRNLKGGIEIDDQVWEEVLHLIE